MTRYKIVFVRIIENDKLTYSLTPEDEERLSYIMKRLKEDGLVPTDYTCELVVTIDVKTKRKNSYGHVPEVPVK